MMKLKRALCAVLSALMLLSLPIVSGCSTPEIAMTVDGREFARATATYTQEELNKRQTRDSRKRGIL